MSVHGLNHFNIMATQPLLGEVRDFYVDVIGLAEGARPDFGVPGHWLYAGDQALVHLVDATGWSEEDVEVCAPSYLDHVAFTCTDIDATEKRLLDMGCEVNRSEFPEAGIYQLFLKDPSGLGVELNFVG